MKFFSYFTVTVLLTLGLSISFQSLLAAWTAPLVGPPTCVAGNPGCDEPLNVSSVAQQKIGGLVLNTGGVATNGLIVDDNGDPTKGNVGIGKTNPGEKLDVDGNVQAAAFIYSSDRNLKKDIEKIDNALLKIRQLEGVSFKWKANSQPSLGIIAQDIEKVFPELVSTNENTGLKSVQYGNLVAPLIEAIKEQQKKIQELESRIEKLETKN